MKLGLFTAALPGLSLEDIAGWASGTGFQMLEIACWPADEGKDRKYGGVVHIDTKKLDSAKVEEIQAMLSEKGLSISSLGYYPNPLDPDMEARNHCIHHLKSVIAAAGRLGVPTVGTLAGRTWDPAATGRVWQKDIDLNFEQFEKVWPDLVKYAADNGVKIAIEHCPMLWADTWPGGSNLPYSPALIRRMFETIQDSNFGLNLDPSHLIWQHIDYIRFINEFKDRIFHVHAKDMDIDRDLLYEDGIVTCGFRWQRPRLPGMGLIDWKKLITTLYDVGYNFVLSIEHEDRNFEGTEALVKRGFLVARKPLEMHII